MTSELHDFLLAFESKFNEGVILEEGTPDEVFNNPKEARTKEFLDKVMY